MYKKILGACLGLAIAAPVFADEIPGITISPMVGYTFLKDEVENAGHWSLGLGYQFDNPWAIEFVYSDLGTDLTNQAVDLDFTRWHIDGLYHTEQIGDLRPYLAFGVGNGDYDYSPGLSDSDTLFNLGVGAKYALGGSNTSLRGDLKVFAADGINKANIAMAVGIQHVFGKAKAKPMMQEPTVLDSDNDGVIDSIDKCPSTPPGVAVNGMGCPRDDDGDGVMNSLDKCPRTPRGVAVNAMGCALDDDNDGVPNHMDQCPNTTDKRAMIDAKGCYKMLMETVEVDLMVEFDNNSSAARPEHRAEVRKVFEFMVSYPNTEVTIEGHTDSRGEESYNKNLSQKRANTIAEMLITEFGIQRSRVSTQGYGEARPIASNETAAGRQQNRRVVGVVKATVEKMEKMK